MKQHYIAIIAAVITSIVTVIAWYVQISEKRMIEFAVKNEVVESRYQINELKDELNQLLAKQLAEAPKSIEIAALDERFKNIEDKIENVKQQTTGLRQAINPTKPEEILTIARLADEVKGMKKDLNDLEQKLSSQQETFQGSILREIKSSSDSTTLILVVLVPLVLNFLYTVWKDIKSEKNVQEKP